LGLNKGANVVTFSVNNQGRKLYATIYLWDMNSKIVVSDVDGTITKSDVLGQILPTMGKDWSHSGVAQLYSNINANGYKLVYLTSRAIGQSNITRAYIQELKQQGGHLLPDGPVIMSPDRLFASFHREVIKKRPDEFKTRCLRNIKSLFPKRNPFYAGFGNRITDVIAYRAAGISSGKIFIINPRSELNTCNLLTSYKTTYFELNGLVYEIFPPRHIKAKCLDEQYNDFNYWKVPLPSLDLLQDKK